MKILNLYAGLGGNRTLWNGHWITAVENKPIIAEIYKKRFPDDEVHIQDVKDFLTKVNLNYFDFIWASPPCKSHSHMQIFTKNNRLPRIPRSDETIGLAVWLKRVFKGSFVIENVVPWYGVIDLSHRKINYIIIDRHLFYSNFFIPRRQTKKGKNRHGEIGGIMRESREELMKKYNLSTWIVDELKGVHDKDQIIRNCVDPKLGKYILNQIHTPELLSYLEKTPNEALK